MADCLTFPGDERLVTLSEIANDCFGIECLAPQAEARDARYVLVHAGSILRALESAYDIGLIAGYRLHRIDTK
jgi:hypothetical protein